MKQWYGPDPDNLPFIDEVVARIRGVGNLEEGHAIAFQETMPILATATSARASMLSSASEMIAALHWADFEIMVDLIFARGGW